MYVPQKTNIPPRNMWTAHRGPTPRGSKRKWQKRTWGEPKTVALSGFIFLSLNQRKEAVQGGCRYPSPGSTARRLTPRDSSGRFFVRSVPVRASLEEHALRRHHKRGGRSRLPPERLRQHSDGLAFRSLRAAFGLCPALPRISGHEPPLLFLVGSSYARASGGRDGLVARKTRLGPTSKA